MSAEKNIFEFKERIFSPREPRTITALLVARIRRENDHDGLCLIRNISPHGLMAEAVLPFSPGEPVDIDLRTGQVLKGDVRWTKEGRFGIEFRTPIIDLERVLREAPSESNSHLVARSLRLEVDCSADMQCGGRHYLAVVSNVSQCGARVTTTAPLQRDDLLKLSISGLTSRQASVRWIQGPVAGLSFLNGLPYAELARWLNTPDLRFARRGSLRAEPRPPY